ncbi:E3 SUMO-protein ligase PIAS1 [Cryptococcus neoformans Bt85]|nr:E3 SUMO-protein ligase PIAS1 [Cryptococcus neoformans var. grubii Bt85]OXM76220.1 E3 SUMO-protein ligase PIAS1 [Cryptococcus neoformans var. grubii Bt63]
MMLRHTGTYRAPVRKTDWSGFDEFLRLWIPSHTVPQLRSFASALVTYGRRDPFMRSGDRKADVIQKIQEAFMALKARMDLDAYVEARYHCEVAVGGGWDPFPRTNTTILIPPAPPIRTHPSVQPPPPPTFGGVPRWSSGVNSSSSGLNGYRSTPGSGSNSVGYGNTSAHAAPSTPSHGPQHALQDWKINPLWKPLRAVTSMETLPDISANESHSTYRTKRTQFVLPNDVIEKLKASRESPQTPPHYSLRLFCTSSDHYRPTSVHARHIPPSTNIPIEYPGNPEVSIDGTILPFKEKGLRGKAGSAPPFDLDKPINVAVGGRVALVPGRLIGVNVGHRGPTTGKNKSQSKRFFFQIVLAEMTTKEELLEKLNKLEPTKAEDAIEQLRKKQEDDDDIVAGTASMSLKDPLSYMRMIRPIRSSKCSHIQCFDATWWIESNAVHPQWLCPHCSKELRFDDLIVDGYVMDILKAVPDTVDDVILEPTGEWHTEDNKYGTASWLASHVKPSSATAAVSTPVASSALASFSSEIETKPSVCDMNDTSSGDGANRGGAGLKRKVVQVIDSDDEGDGTPAKSSVPPAGRITGLGSSSSVGGSRTGASTPIIDLTLSDSDDETDEETGSATSSRGPPAPIQVPRTSTAASAIVSPKRPVSAAWTNFHSSRETTSNVIRSPSTSSWPGLSTAGIGGVSGRSSPLSNINGQTSASASGSATTSHLQPPSDQYPPISPPHISGPPPQTTVASPRIAGLPPPSHIFPSSPSPASIAPAAPPPHVPPVRAFSRPGWVNPLGPSSSSEISSSTYASATPP